MMVVKRKAESTSAQPVKRDLTTSPNLPESGSHKMYVESLTLMSESDSLQGQLTEPQPLEDLLQLASMMQQ